MFSNFFKFTNLGSTDEAQNVDDDTNPNTHGKRTIPGQLFPGSQLVDRKRQKTRSSSFADPGNRASQSSKTDTTRLSGQASASVVKRKKTHLSKPQTNNSTVQRLLPPVNDRLPIIQAPFTFTSVSPVTIQPSLGNAASSSLQRTGNPPTLSASRAPPESSGNQISFTTKRGRTRDSEDSLEEVEETKNSKVYTSKTKVRLIDNGDASMRQHVDQQAILSRGFADENQRLQEQIATLSAQLEQSIRSQESAAKSLNEASQLEAQLRREKGGLLELLHEKQMEMVQLQERLEQKSEEKIEDMIKEGRNRELLLNERITHLEQQCEAQLLKTAAVQKDLFSLQREHREALSNSLPDENITDLERLVSSTGPQPPLAGPSRLPTAGPSQPLGAREPMDVDDNLSGQEGYESDPDQTNRILQPSERALGKRRNDGEQGPATRIKLAKSINKMTNPRLHNMTFSNNVSSQRTERETIAPPLRFKKPAGRGSLPMMSRLRLPASDTTSPTRSRCFPVTAPLAASSPTANCTLQVPPTVPSPPVPSSSHSSNTQDPQPQPTNYDRVLETLLQKIDNVTSAVTSMRTEFEAQKSSPSPTKKRLNEHSPFKVRRAHNPRTPEHTSLMNEVRRAMNELLDIKHDCDIFHAVSEQEPVTTAEVEEFDTGVSDGPSLIPVRIFWEDVQSSWNVELADLFSLQFITDNPEYADESASIRTHFLHRIQTLRTALSKHVPLNELETDQQISERICENQHGVRRRNRTRSRKETLFQSRLNITREAAAAGTDAEEKEGWGHLHNMVDELGVDGMSSDDSDGDRHVVRRKEWRSKVVEAGLMFIDEHRNTRNAYGNRLPGGRPRIRVRNSNLACISTNPPRACQPKNFYDETWFESLSNRNKTSLAPRPEMMLPTLED